MMNTSSITEVRGSGFPWLAKGMVWAGFLLVMAGLGMADEPLVPVPSNRAPEPQTAEATPPGGAPDVKPGLGEPDPTTPTWDAVAAILRAKCAGCHNDGDAEAGFSVSSHASLRRGIEGSPVYVPGRSADSLMIRLANGSAEPAMPPEGEPQLTHAEIATLAAWIDAGAIPPSGASDVIPLNVPRITVPGDRPLPVTAIAVHPLGGEILIGRYGRIERVDAQTGQLRSILDGFSGKVTAVTVLPEGFGSVTEPVVVAGSGIAGLTGEVTVRRLADGETLATWTVGADLPYAVVVSPDRSRIAVGGYDRVIRLLEARSVDNGATGGPIRELAGHNGAVFGLAFDQTGATLASASADATIKLWRTADGERLDTLSQPLEEMSAVLFPADGQSIVAAGRDRRLRQWAYRSRTKPEINPQGTVRFAHETPIVHLLATRDGKTLITVSEAGEIKTWDAVSLDQQRVVRAAGEAVSAVATGPGEDEITVGRFDGVWSVLSLRPSEVVAASEPSPPESGASEPSPPEPIVSDSISSESKPAAGRESATEAMPSEPLPTIVESEPNDNPATAPVVPVPTRITGRIARAADADGGGDRDCFAFEAAAGSRWQIELDAARSKSPLDGFVEVLTSEGQPILRERLQAVRESYFTFRGKNSTQTDDFRVFGWEEMKLNEYFYSGGEVTKLWLAPRGADSGFKVYPGVGNRWTYFGTSAVTHALGEPAYVVQPVGPEGPIVDNGLPVFPIFYENDDDPRQQWGRDSRLDFQAPVAGRYVVRVRDRRGFGGDDFRYTLTIRPQRPDFTVRLSTTKLKVPPGSGRMFELRIDRLDGFEGPVSVTFENVPDGWAVTSPIVLEAGQSFAEAAVLATPDAKPQDQAALKALRIRASATIAGQPIVHDVPSFTAWEVGDEPRLWLRLQPEASAGATTESGDSDVATGPPEKADDLEPTTSPGDRSDGDGEPDPPGDPLTQPWALETPTITIHPGETITARAIVRRRAFDGRVELGTDGAGRNLPHAVYVDNIGLNGLLIVEGTDERTFFITADPIATPQERLFFLRANNVDGETSWPLRLRVLPPRGAQ